jgi:hypothetical protein
MNNLETLDLNDSNITKNKIVKQIYQLGTKHLVLIDESIIQKLSITKNSILFVEQELTQDNKTIMLRVVEFNRTTHFIVDRRETPKIGEI